MAEKVIKIGFKEIELKDIDNQMNIQTSFQLTFTQI